MYEAVDLLILLIVHCLRYLRQGAEFRFVHLNAGG